MRCTPTPRNPFAHPELLDVERLEPWTVPELWIMGPGGQQAGVAVDTTATVERKVAALAVPQEPDVGSRRRGPAGARLGPWQRGAGRTSRGPLRRALPGHPHSLSDMGTGDPWLLVQHVAFEGPGAIADAIADTGADLTVLRMDRGDALPPPDAVADVAGLVVMGGPMSVHDDLPWLADERALLRRAVEAGRPVLGVCLGAQQLAAALGRRGDSRAGARVRRR